MGYTVGIISPGDMGSGIGEKLAKNGARVVVALDARSERTKALAAAAGLEDVGSVERLVQEASHVLSVMVPSEAVSAAERVAQALQNDRRLADLRRPERDLAGHHEAGRRDRGGGRGALRGRRDHRRAAARLGEPAHLPLRPERRRTWRSWRSTG